MATQELHLGVVTAGTEGCWEPADEEDDDGENNSDPAHDQRDGGGWRVGEGEEDVSE